MRVLRMRADRDGDPAPSAAPTLFFRLTDRKMKTNFDPTLWATRAHPFSVPRFRVHSRASTA